MVVIYRGNLPELKELIDKLESAAEYCDIPEEHLREIGWQTREEYGIGEHSFGIVTVPVAYVIGYLKELCHYKQERRVKIDSSNLSEYCRMLGQIKQEMAKHERPETYLREIGEVTHSEYGIGEHGYGIVTTPAIYVIDYLNELFRYKEAERRTTWKEGFSRL